MDPLLPEGYNNIESELSETEESAYKNILVPYKNAVVFFCLNNRQLKYYLPILEKIDCKVVLLSRADLDETLLQKNNIEIIEFDLIAEEVVMHHDYLKNTFPRLFYLANTYFILIKYIQPRCVIFLEGCHSEAEIISAICKSFSIKTVCIQQGWPALIHTRFIQMTYDYYCTWGNAFTVLWKNHNTFSKFIETGYLYEVNKMQTDKTDIAFFFQAPLFTISNETLQKMIEFALFCAEHFPERDILIREHPEYPFNTELIDSLERHRNIRIVSQKNISTVFALSEICVSVFSSTLMESIIHDSIPFVFNLTSMPRYYPDVEKEELGLEANTYDDACKKILRLLSDKTYKAQIQKNISEKKPAYFKSIGEESVNNILKLIKEIS